VGWGKEKVRDRGGERGRMGSGGRRRV